MKTEIREKLINAPVIGRVAAAFCLPKQQREEIESLRNLCRELQSLNAGLRQDCDELRGKLAREESERQRTDERVSAVAERQNAADASADERWNAATATFDSLGEGIRGQERRLAEEQEARESAFDKGMETLLRDGERLSVLRSELSLHNAVWGSRERLHISPDAYVDSCLMNTNSGEITVEEFTFAGPGVSLLAGTHDIRLTGFPRRDLTPQSGCDIRIGKGVWLCANCTVLGPCQIGDHAVIAAGAVVTPGTEVEPYAVYAGVPARKIRIAETYSESDAEALQPDGKLYTCGWYARECVGTGNEVVTGRWMIRKEAEILLRAGDETLRYLYPAADAVPNTVTVALGDWTETFVPTARGEICIPAEAFGSEKQGLLRLTADRLWSPGNGDPRELGVFVY